MCINEKMCFVFLLAMTIETFFSHWSFVTWWQKYKSKNILLHILSYFEKVAMRFFFWLRKCPHSWIVFFVWGNLEDNYILFQQFSFCKVHNSKEILSYEQENWALQMNPTSSNWLLVIYLCNLTFKWRKLLRPPILSIKSNF
jgi:hypothetical protein